VDYVLLEACTGYSPAVKQRVMRILAQRRASLKTIRHIMRGKFCIALFKYVFNCIFIFNNLLIIFSMFIFYYHYHAEYAGNLGDAGDIEWKKAEQQHILQLIDKF